MANSHEYIKYEGSLTSPPCTEGIRWFLLNDRGQVKLIDILLNIEFNLKISQEQINAFKEIFGKDTNVRGLQHLNDRVFSVFSN